MLLLSEERHYYYGLLPNIVNRKFFLNGMFLSKSVVVVFYSTIQPNPLLA